MVVEFHEGVLVREVPALSVRDGHLVSPVLKTPGQRTVLGLRPDVHVPAHETLADVVQQGPRKQPCLTEHLKAVAHPEDQTALACMFDHLLHDRGKTRDGPRTEVVPIGKATRKDDHIDSLQVMLLVP